MEKTTYSPAELQKPQKVQYTPDEIKRMSEEVRLVCVRAAQKAPTLNFRNPLKEKTERALRRYRAL